MRGGEHRSVGGASRQEEGAEGAVGAVGSGLGARARRRRAAEALGGDAAAAAVAADDVVGRQRTWLGLGRLVLAIAVAVGDKA